MKEYLMSLMWIIISNKLKLSIEDLKNIIYLIYKIYSNQDIHFSYSNYDSCTIDALEFYLESIKYLE